jgi:GTP pyrophosphokinase
LKEFRENGALEQALSRLGFAALDDFYAAVGYGKTTPQSLLSALMPDTDLEIKPEGAVARAMRRALGRGARGVKVSGEDDMMVSLARCCNPVRGEPIVGYITRGKGVSVHSVHCSNVTQLMYDPGRKIDVEWTPGRDGDSLFDVKLQLEVDDRQGLLAKIVSTIAEEKTNIKNVEAQTFDTSEAKIVIIISVADRKQMDRVIGRVRRIKGVREVERLRS